MNDDTENIILPFPKADRQKDCAGQYFGAWAVEPRWFANAVNAVKTGLLKPAAGGGKRGGNSGSGGHVASGFDDGDEEDQKGYYIVQQIAVIVIDGQMTKRGGSFSGCSTTRVRKALREAANDYMVRGILLQICSPGGSVSGTADLADDVLAVRTGTIKTHTGKGLPVEAFIEDMGCSAAYWVASQCGRIEANKTAMVGCIGTYTVLEDDTGAQEQFGVKYRVISTGKYKGLGADGKISEELISDVQREVDELNMPFLAAVAAGRGKKIDIAAVSDGRSWVGEQALSLGLIDAIASLDAAIMSLSTRSPFMNLEQFKAFAAENPNAVATYIEQGKKAGATETLTAEKVRAQGCREAAAGNESLAWDFYLAGKDGEDVKLAVNAIKRESDAATKAKTDADAAVAKANADATAALAVKDAEIVRLKAEAGTQGAVGTSTAAKAASDKAKEEIKSAEEFEKIEDPKARAEAEWKADFEGCRAAFSSEAAYVAYRKVELRGGVKRGKAAK